MKKQLSLLLKIFLIGTGMQAQSVVIDLTTGYSNTNNALIPFTQSDDTWQVKTPSNSSPNPAKVCSNTPGGAWATDNCGRWISPQITSAGQAAQTSSGSYTYVMQFTAVCPLYSGITRIVLNKVGTDNVITNIKVNGSSYSISQNFPSNFNPLSSVVINISPTDIVAGVNTIEFVTYNLDLFNGLFLCGYMEYQKTSNLTNAQIITSKVYCSPDPISVQGSVTNNALFHFWTIFESDAQGNLLTGGFNYTSSNINGNPTGSYVFPVQPPCNKYYRITLNVSGPCNSLIKHAVIFINCNNPAFSLSNNTSNSSYYTISATPNEVAPYNSSSNFGYAWFVEELNANNNSIFIINNPNGWWTFTSNNNGFVNNFDGINCVSVNYAGTYNSVPSNPSPGRFLYGKKYRITRGTWVNDPLSNESICDYHSFSQTIVVNLLQQRETGENVVETIVEDVNDLDDLKNLKPINFLLNDPKQNGNGFDVSPNPSNGLLTLTNQRSSNSIITLKILGVSGSVIETQRVTFSMEQNIVRIDLTHLPEGIYLLQIEGELDLKKIVIQK